MSTTYCPFLFFFSQNYLFINRKRYEGHSFHGIIELKDVGEKCFYNYLPISKDDMLDISTF